MYDAMRLSTQEPEMTVPLRGSLVDLGITRIHFFDPTAPNQIKTIDRTDGISMFVGVAGGWTNQMYSAFPATYYLEAKNYRISLNQVNGGSKLVSSMNLFGKDQTSIKETFAQNAIRNSSVGIRAFQTIFRSLLRLISFGT